MIKVSFSMIVSAAAVFLLCMIGGWAYTSSRPNIYEASARVWIQTKTAPSIIGQSNEIMYSPQTQFYSSPITTASEVMHSKLVVEKAHEVLQKQLGARCPSPQAMLTGFTVSPAKDADVLITRYQDRDASVVAPVLNAILDQFISFNNVQSAGSATQSRLSLETQLARAQANYEQAKLRLANYQTSSQSADPALELDQLIRQNTDLETELAHSRKTLSGLQSKIAYLQEQLGMTPEQAMAMQTLSQDQALNGLKRKIAQDQVELIDARSKFKDEHPHVQTLLLSISRSKTAMEDRIKLLMNGRDASKFPDFDMSPGTDDVKHQLISDIIRARSDELAEEQAISMIEASIIQQKTKLQGFPDRRAQVQEMQQRVNNAAAELNEVERRLQSTKMLENVAYNASNVQIIDRPETPSVPASPNHNSDLLFSALFGIAGGGGTMLLSYLLDPRLYTAEEAIGMLSLTVIGWINQLQTTARNINSIPGMSRLHVALLGPMQKGINRIIICSPGSGDGKTTIAAGLALSLSQAGTKVLLVDANLFQPQLHELFGVSVSPGLRDYLEAPAPATAQRIVRTLNKNLHFMGAGRNDSQLANDLITDQTFTRILEEAQIQPEVIIIDTAPASVSANGLALYNNQSYLIVAVRLGHTLKKAVKDLAAQLRLQNVVQGSIVLTDASEQNIPKEEGPELSGEMSSAW